MPRYDVQRTPRIKAPPEKVFETERISVYHKLDVKRRIFDDTSGFALPESTGTIPAGLSRWSIPQTRGLCVERRGSGGSESHGTLISAARLAAGTRSPPLGSRRVRDFRRSARGGYATSAARLAAGTRSPPLGSRRVPSRCGEPSWTGEGGDPGPDGPGSPCGGTTVLAIIRKPCDGQECPSYDEVFG